jgi:hypothetical protein
MVQMRGNGVRRNISRIGLIAPGAALIALLANAPASADWVAHADFSGCPRAAYPRTHGQEPPVPTEAACQAQIDRARRGDPAVCIRYSCKETGAEASTTAPGDAIEQGMADALAAGLTGEISAAESVGLFALGAAAKGLLSSTGETAAAPDPQARALEAEQALEQQQAARKADETKARLLAQMQGVEDSGELQLMTDDAAPVSSNSTTTGELALMTDDGEVRGIMSERKPRQTRQQPPAAQVSMGPYTPGSRPTATAQKSPEGNQTLATNPGPAGAQAGVIRADAFTSGRMDGVACRQRSASAMCSDRVGNAFGTCLQDYNRGYDAGADTERQRLTGMGAAAGARDRASKRNAALAYPESGGSCGNIFVKAYNQAFR